MSSQSTCWHGLRSSLKTSTLNITDREARVLPLFCFTREKAISSSPDLEALRADKCMNLIEQSSHNLSIDVLPNCCLCNAWCLCNLYKSRSSSDKYDLGARQAKSKPIVNNFFATEYYRPLSASTSTDSCLPPSLSRNAVKCLLLQNSGCFAGF